MAGAGGGRRLVAGLVAAAAMAARANALDPNPEDDAFLTPMNFDGGTCGSPDELLPSTCCIDTYENVCEDGTLDCGTKIFAGCFYSPDFANMGGGGDPYISIGGESFFLEAPPLSDVDLYSRFGGVNVTLTMDEAGLYFADARLEWDQHLLAIKPQAVNEQAASAIATLDGVRLMSSEEPVIVGGVELIVATAFVDVNAVESPSRESFRIFATDNTARKTVDDSSPHIDFAVNNNPSQLFNPTLPPASGALVATYMSQIGFMRRRSRALLFDDVEHPTTTTTTTTFAPCCAEIDPTEDICRCYFFETEGFPFVIDVFTGQGC